MLSSVHTDAVIEERNADCLAVRLRQRLGSDSGGERRGGGVILMYLEDSGGGVGGGWVMH